MSVEEVMQVLKEIRDYCSRSFLYDTCCDGCPYFNKKANRCSISGLPDEWDLEVEE